MWTLLVALLLSGGTAMLGNRANRERIAVAVYTLLSCTFFVFAGGWLMYFIHG